MHSLMMPIFIMKPMIMVALQWHPMPPSRRDYDMSPRDNFLPLLLAKVVGLGAEHGTFLFLRHLLEEEV
ncbi:hypothetical protein QTO34_015485 [Cnephaeus nilssonii]|uniref:Uncharacterized protein n=1 Tax=Cnephaeus nilssonii TaxID=3371016 RepID=A0AA40LT45_CNENI|nr:hypothetical protein QTO34_015485 [Eptesicus nilssonii]